MEIVEVNGGRGFLPRPAAESLHRLDAHTGYLVPVTELGRTYERQLYLYIHQNEPGFNPAWHPDDPRANHVLKEGRSGAADSDYQTGIDWESHGWILTVPHEPWHREYQADKDKYKDIKIGSVDMELYILHENGNVYYMRPGKLKKFTSVKDYEAWAKIVNDLRAQGATNMIKPPALSKLRKFAAWRFEALAENFGV